LPLTVRTPTIGREMVVSILRRKSRVTDRARWQAQLTSVLPKITSILQKAPGFVSVQYAWDLNDEGAFAQITTWNSEDECKRYVREGAAATIATIEEAAIPTALHPDGQWLRQTYEVTEP
jgi:heme-degrading monooxygenase HmoA